MVHFFTALPPWSAEKRDRHQVLLDVYRDLSVNIVEGQFRLTTGRCWGSCKELFEAWSEKETDINIALALARIAKEKMCEKVILLTGDTDQAPSIRYAKELCPNLRVKVVLPPHRRADALKSAADEHASINEAHLLDEIYTCKRKPGEIRCPSRWK